MSTKHAPIQAPAPKQAVAETPAGASAAPQAEADKRKARAERFGVVSDEEKKKSRAERSVAQVPGAMHVLMNC